MPSIVTNLRSQFGQWIKSALGGSGVTPQQWLRGDENTSAGAELINPLTQSVWVYACISKTAEVIGQIPWMITQGERGTGQRILSGPLFELFERPHPNLDKFAFWDLLIQWFLMRGEAFIVALDADNAVINLSNRNAGRDIRALAILSPDGFYPIIQNHRLEAWRYSGSNILSPVDSALLLPEEVIVLKTPNPFNFWRGLPPLQAALLPAQTDFAGGMFAKGMMLNNADMGLIVSVEHQLSEEQRTQMNAALVARKRKAGTADRPIILEGGAKIEKPTLAVASQEVLNQRKFNRQEICACFGVPQEVLGFSEDANRSVSETAFTGWIDNKIAPMAARIEAALQPVVRAYGRGTVGWFAVDNLPTRQAARRARFASAKDAFVNMGIPLRVLNTEFDLNLPDDLPHYNDSFLPMNLERIGTGADLEGADEQVDDGSGEMVPTGDVVQDAFQRLASGLQLLAASGQDTQAVSGENGQGPDTTHVLADKAGEAQTTTEPVLSTVAQRGLSQAYMASIKASEKKKRGTLRRFFLEQRQRALAQLKLNVPTKAVRDPGELLNLPDEDRLLTDRLGKLLTLDLQFGAAQVAAEIGIDFTLAPSEALTYLAERESKIVGINATTDAILRSQVGEGIALGESFEALADRVKEVFADATDHRAEVIALTETNTAINTGRFSAMKDAGITHKAWLTSHLENIRPTHQACERIGSIPIDEVFEPNGLMHPGDPNGPANEVINCRCHLIAVPDPENDPSLASTPSAFVRIGFGEWLEEQTKATHQP